MAASFGSLVRQYRVRMGLGLREFSELLGWQPSRLSAIEHNQSPLRSYELLAELASKLGLEQHSREWDEFFTAAKRPKEAPVDVQNCLERPAVISLLRTIDRTKPTEEQLRRLQQLLDNERSIQSHDE